MGVRSARHAEAARENPEGRKNTGEKLKGERRLPKWESVPLGMRTLHRKAVELLGPCILTPRVQMHPWDEARGSETKLGLGCAHQAEPPSLLLMTIQAPDSSGQLMSGSHPASYEPNCGAEGRPRGDQLLPAASSG
ncbi:hypothetical protein NDU88_000365 [Pleurodeles waltl]|uniref:Uncharacterized protein n=1 Tax=Pleurodeles waltl TaxID=8319 RepID=A0AAV7V8U1_PLEWA|nr:hypothetical protein NDU88_000365 [Pleurodeles waltl]